MKLNPSICIDPRYKAQNVLVYIKITWTESYRKYGATKFSTGIYLDKEDWDKKKKQIKTRSLDPVKNQDLIKIRDRINKIMDYCRAIDFETSKESVSAIRNYIEFMQNEIKPILLERLSDFVQAYIQMYKKKLSYNGIRKYNTVLRNLMMYCELNGVSDILAVMNEDQQTIFFNGYLEFLAEHEGANKWGKPKMKYNNSSIKGEFRLLTSVCNSFKSTGLKVDLDFAFGLGEGNTERTYCTPAELQIIWNKRNEQVWPSKILRAVDNFLMQAYTGCRHQDLYEFESIRIKSYQNFRTWTYYSNKVKMSEVTVPLNHICESIMNHWQETGFKPPLRTNPKTKEQTLCRNVLIPVMSSNKVNEYLHEFLKNIPAFQGVEKQVRYRLSERIETEIPRWQLITSHVARHSYSHLLTSSGMTIDETSHLLNHTSSETTKKHYAHFGTDEIMEKALNILNK